MRRYSAGRDRTRAPGGMTTRPVGQYRPSCANSRDVPARRDDHTRRAFDDPSTQTDPALVAGGAHPPGIVSVGIEQLEQGCRVIGAAVRQLFRELGTSLPEVEFRKAQVVKDCDPPMSHGAGDNRNRWCGELPTW